MRSYAASTKSGRKIERDLGTREDQTTNLAVTVALVGDPARPYTSDEAEWNRPWDDRPKVEFQIHEDDTLWSVLERASAAHSFEMDFYPWFAFYEANEARGFAESITWKLLLIDVDRETVYGASDPHQITYRELLASVEAGTVRGDPLRLHLIVPITAGGGVSPEWWMILEGLEVLWRVIVAAAALDGAISLVARLYGPIRYSILRVRRALGAHAPELDRRAIGPDDMVGLLEIREWSSEEFARRLGCSIEDAEAILTGFGYEHDPATDHWQRGTDAPASLLSSVVAATLGTGDVAPGFGDVLLRDTVERLVTEASIRTSSVRSEDS